MLPMKLRNPWLLKVVSLAVACLVRAWVATLRYRSRMLGGDVHPDRAANRGQRFIFAFWHEYLLLPAYHYARPDVWVLISRHADGQLIADACRHLGLKVVRGSTSRGNLAAVRDIVRVLARGHVAVTPDGPRGPRRRVPLGLVHLASQTGAPIVPLGFGLRRPWRMRSWDRFALPRPFGSSAGVSGEPIRVPPGAGKEQLEEYRKKVEAELLRVTELAEAWAERQSWPCEAPARGPDSLAA
jgi:lysophospholipid acyltransferase (LPLAT)-like uncharacterized protein